MRAFGLWVAGAALAMSAATAVAADDALVKTLKERDGKVATLVLASGLELSGKVSGVSNHSVKLSELRGKEFSDAVIDLDHVQAVVYRAREQ